jgi:outer membrane protein OmpA-like peptidoglycan-associated protein
MELPLCAPQEKPLPVLALTTALLLNQVVGNPKSCGFVKPQEGSYIVEASVAESEEVAFPMRAGKDGKAIPQTLQGRLSYCAMNHPSGRSGGEVSRDYKQALQRAGMELLFECTGAACGRFEPHRPTKGSAVYGHATGRYMAFKGSQGGRLGYAFFFINNELTYLHFVEPTEKEAGKAQLSADLLAEGLESIGRVALHGIVFDANRPKLKSESEPQLKEIARLMKAQPTLKLHVVGHTDNAGSLKASMELSRRRAEAVVSALVKKHGVAKARLNPAGVGPLVPLSSNDTEPGRAKNRRVELVKQ